MGTGHSVRGNTKWLHCVSRFQHICADCTSIILHSTQADTYITQLQYYQSSISFCNYVLQGQAHPVNQSGIRLFWIYKKKSITWQRPPVSSFFVVLTKTTLLSHLMSLGNSTLVCRTLVSKNESIWRVIFTCNEPENHHARKPNYECLILWQPNKYFTL